MQGGIPRTFFVTGIDTDAGKTVVSAILTLGLQAHYWKPVQAGSPTDTHTVQALTGLPAERFLPEAYCLEHPMSPHASAAAEGIEIDPNKLLCLPKVEGPLLIEGAGGLMVPLRGDYLYIDWLEQVKIPTLLVIKTYLGCINHSLLSLDAMRQRGIPLAGIVFNEGGHPESEEVIKAYAKVAVWGKIPVLPELNPKTLQAAFNHYFLIP
ncbi:UNVERIFIED_CONTAM: hypothetical protein GTU68_061035 [Idotea baltica]|nr:hypothetical protein [Idotea baltica]